MSDWEELLSLHGEDDPLTPEVEEIIFSFMSYITVQKDFVVGRNNSPHYILEHYKKWRNEKRYISK
jgi:hypothetical protein